LLNNDINVEECDATYADSSSSADYTIKIIHLSIYNSFLINEEPKFPL